MMGPCQASKARTRLGRDGLTLLELLVTLIILVALAAVVLPLLGTVTETAKHDVTLANMQTLRAAIMGQPGYLADVRQMPRTVCDLFKANTVDLSLAQRTFNPDTHLGWHGPYLLNTGGTYNQDAVNNFLVQYGGNGDPAVLDGWGRPIILQLPSGLLTDPNARLVSPGPNVKVDSPLTAASPTELTSSLRGDDIVLFLRVSDVVTTP